MPTNRNKEAKSTKSSPLFRLCFGIHTTQPCYFTPNYSHDNIFPELLLILTILRRMKILIVEDEPGILHSITAYFTRVGYLCEVATTYRAAVEKIHLYQYDCVILDITLPDGNGLDVLEQLKMSKSSAGVLILSAKDSLDDRVKGLELGADDYLPKPFHLTELNARVMSLLRRIKFEGNKEVTMGNLRLHLDQRSVYVNNTELLLKNKEYELLLFFISNPQRVVSKSSLAEHIWGDHIDQADSFDFLYSQIKNLRKKLSEYQANYTIQAMYGLGYKFIKNEVA